MQVVVYDGDCAMCSRFIQLFVNINKNPNLYITDFSSQWVQKNVILDPNVDSVLFITEDKVYTYSEAIIYMFAAANGYGKLLFIFKLIPRVVRSGIYKWIARHRKKLVAKDCSIPTREMKKMYLT